MWSKAPAATPAPVIQVFGALVAACAVWAIVTGIGLLELQRWSGTSILVLAPVLAAYSILSFFSVLIATRYVGWNQLTAPRLIVAVLIEGVQVLVAIWWIVLFRRGRMNDAV
jgi:hypothetical protein